ncbi:MAG TPA: hypothetical protein VFU65_00525 [Actinocrinis sp.]|nr:hypothetical protein [Actinocrinis sp.]
MRIAMIGDSDAGKTTYMAMMFEAMVKGYKGFQLETSDAQHGVDLLVEARGIHKGAYPPPSSQRKQFEFRLAHKKKYFFDFTWSDYRGGALTERATGADSEEVHRELLDADGIVVFADAPRFAREPAAARLARRLTVVTQRAIGERGRPIPVVIAYTKADLVGARSDWDLAVKPFAALQSAMDQSPNVQGVTVRISCGRKSKNVHIPVLWCLSHHIIARVDELQSDYEYHKRLQAAAQAGATTWNSLKSWWNNETSEAQRARERGAQAARVYQQMLPLREPARDLARLVRRNLAQ